MRTAHLFAGAGGGILADLILGHTPVLAIEQDPRRCALLRHRYPGLAVAEGDCRSMDFSQWHGRVDCLSAGIPCPKWSSARRGMGQPEDLLDETVRIISEIRPTHVFIECVPGFKKEHHRLRCALGYIGVSLAQPLILDVSRVGAPMPRARYWALGRADQEGKPVLPVHAEMAELPPPDASPWEIDRTVLQMADRLADKWEMESVGDGWCPLQAAVAWCILGGR